MKSSITSFTIFILMMLSILFSIQYLNTICSKLESSNIKIEKSIESNSWNEARKNYENFMIQWEKYSPKVSIFSNHNEIDNINSELWKLMQHITYRNGEESLASINVIKNLLHHILKMEQLNIQNLF
ncbi:DUF4363 family protein [Clostridium autoethanogenum]|uniref:DUF4363 domain-containing protein n=2 Tax=Clostridium TaxID=1485 RepID=D8GLH0_CLOLD|nr:MULTISPECIES: DUF4363 family protein [Clostridium]ADK13366.1 conserved hypothetical protein [Clostridium ljungdahlii DSM 13528]OAA88984.1 hypothetical protein WX45_02225 [Clostridium ljungdahlii DSM 13528]RMD04866.1 DUF4363 family protein [Clostridium autoethanogenum]